MACNMLAIMRKLLVVSVFMILSQVCLSQGTHKFKINKVIIDKCEFECIYYHRVYDENYMRSETEYNILQISNKYTKYWSYDTYQVDSIIQARNIKEITFDEYSSISKGLQVSTDYMVKDFFKGEIYDYCHIFIDYYVYTEPTPAIKWNFVKGTDVVCGYKCKKATATFRGRNWTAWYAPEIPYMEGPWKFNGLPGLILRIEDDKNEHVFEATSIRMANSPITKVLKDYIPTTRENFNKALSEYKSDPSAVLGASELAPKDANGKPIPLPKRRMFYNPIELE